MVISEVEKPDARLEVAAYALALIGAVVPSLEALSAVMRLTPETAHDG